MGSQVRTLLNGMSRLHDDERGEEGLNKLLIFALVAIPLLILLMVFGKKIVDYAKQKFNEAFGKEIKGADSTK